MSFRELVFRILLISTVHCSMMSVVQSQRSYIVRLLPEPARNLEHIPDRWRTLHPEFKAPQIEIQLLKSYVSPDENWMFAKEYKYSGKDYYGATKMTSMTSMTDLSSMTSMTDEKKNLRIENGDMGMTEKEKENNVPDNIVMPDGFIPQIESRNIITIPIYCPKGQRKDSIGRCRTIIM